MRKARILMVEDETDVLALNQAFFLAQGYDVICAKTIKEARSAAYEYPPDIVLLDVLLPDGSGYDFCREMRTLTSAPIIYLTCMGKDEDAIKGLLAGGDDYISKPYNLDVLSARVVSCLRRSGLVNAGRIEKPPLVIDHLTGRVTLGKKEINFSQKEKQLLSYLVCNAGREFSSAELYSAIWGEGESPSTVRSHIANIRKKLAEHDDGFFEICLTAGRKYMFLQTRYSQP